MPEFNDPLTEWIINDTNKTYYALRDRIIYKTDGVLPYPPLPLVPVSVTFDANLLNEEGVPPYNIHHIGIFIDDDVDLVVPSNAPEGEYEIGTWDMTQVEEISGNVFTCKLGYNLHFFVLHKPVLTLNVTSNNKNVTLILESGSIKLSKVEIKWGDDSPTTKDIFKTEFTHTYDSYNKYKISVKLINSRDLSVTKTITVTLTRPIPVGISDVMYLIDQNTNIQCPLDFTSWRITQIAKRADINVVTSNRSIKLGMFISINVSGVSNIDRDIPYIFYIEKISKQNGQCTVTGVDMATAALRRRICMNATNTGNGYDKYDGMGGVIIPEIFLRNCTDDHRKFVTIQAPVAKAVGRICHIQGRFGTVLKLYEEAVDKSGVTMQCNLISSEEELVIGIEIIEPKNRDIKLSTEFDCGKIITYNESDKPNICYAGGSGELRSRIIGTHETSESALGDFHRYEVFEDASSAVNLEDAVDAAKTRIESEQNISVVYEIWSSCPYKISPNGDLWIGDTCVVDCGEDGNKTLKLSKIDIAMSSKNGLTRQLTFGLNYEPVERTVVNIGTCGVRNLK